MLIDFIVHGIIFTIIGCTFKWMMLMYEYSELTYTDCGKLTHKIRFSRSSKFNVTKIEYRQCRGLFCIATPEGDQEVVIKFQTDSKSFSNPFTSKSHRTSFFLSLKKPRLSFLLPWVVPQHCLVSWQQYQLANSSSSLVRWSKSLLKSPQSSNTLVECRNYDWSWCNCLDKFIHNPY